MKLMIASDLHGSAAYTRRLLKLYRDTGCQRLVLLGDLLYHGPRNPLPEGYEPPAVAKMLNDMADELLCVRGNCDAEVDQMVLHFPILSDSALLVLDGLTIHATHGHIHGPDTAPAAGRYPVVRTLPCAGAPGLRPLHLSESRLRSPAQGEQPPQLYGAGGRTVHMAGRGDGSALPAPWMTVLLDAA